MASSSSSRLAQMKSTLWVVLLSVLGVSVALSMPSMDDDSETTVEDVTMHSEMNATDEDKGWVEVGESVEATMEEADKDELEDVSDPPVMSEDKCPEVLNLLNSMPAGLMRSLEELKQDHPFGNEPCFRAREYFDADIRQGSRRPLCSGPFYVVYGQYRYCCADAARHHPLVERYGNRIRCRC